MLKATWRNLLARKLRLVLSALAIVLGVAFVAGSFIFTDAMGGAFDDIIQGSTADAEVGYPGANNFDSAEDSRTIPAVVATRLAGLPEVASVHPKLQLRTVFLIGRDGKVVGGNGPPGLAFNPSDALSVGGQPVMRLVAGRMPDAPHEVALEEGTADRAGFHVGDDVRFATPGAPPVIQAHVTGIIHAGSPSAGATIAVFGTAFLQQQFFGGRDVFTSIDLDARPGVSQRQLADAATRVIPHGLLARTGDDKVAANRAVVDQFLGFLQPFLLVFAGVALFVGAFIIINTFSILVAQRSRELALLRTLGASRRQVRLSVVIEALAVGAIGSTLGLGTGYLVARGLAWVFGRFGLDLSHAGFPLGARTVVASYVVGLVVTVIAAWLPARRASRIPPVQALRDEVALPETALHRRLLTGAGLAVLGVGAMTAGFTRTGDASTSLSLIGLGMALVLVGAAMLSPLAARPVIHLFGVPYSRAFGAVGRLATQNSVRNPRRTAATASALMVGLALVAMMSVLGRSASESTEVAVDAHLTSQLIVSNVVNQPFSTDVAAQIAHVPGVATVASLRMAEADLSGTHVYGLAAVDPGAVARAFRIPVAAGSLGALGPGTIVVNESLARRAHLTVGQTTRLTLQGAMIPLRVAAVFHTGGGLPAEALVSFDTLVKGAIAPMDSIVFVVESVGADKPAVRAAIEAITRDLPTVTVKDPQGFVDEQKKQIDVFVNFIYGLLGLSVVIAVLGVINTLGLSVIERTREIGLLRAVGMSRRQLRTMVRLESVVVAVFGALLGIALGIAFGVGLITALHDQGLTELGIPWLRLVAFVIAAGFVGVVAAVLPARRAARLDVLRAIATE